jgi:excisionase family DNA binding protein
MSIRSTGLSPDERKGAPGEAIATARGPPPALKPLTVTVKTARQITGLGNTTIYELIGDGTIESLKIGNKRLILFASLERLATPTRSTETPENPAARATEARLAKRARSAVDGRGAS